MSISRERPSALRWHFSQYLMEIKAFTLSQSEVGDPVTYMFNNSFGIFCCFRIHLNIIGSYLFKDSVWIGVFFSCFFSRYFLLIVWISSTSWNRIKILLKKRQAFLIFQEWEENRDFVKQSNSAESNFSPYQGSEQHKTRLV